jgi:hypothetical protein
MFIRCSSRFHQPHRSPKPTCCGCSSPSHHLPHPHSKLPTLCLQIHLCKSFLCVLLSCLGVIFGHLVYLFDSLYCVLSLSKREKMKKLKKKKKKKANNKKEKKIKLSFIQKIKFKRGKLPILFWPFVVSLFWSLLVQLLTQTHLLTFVVSFKNSCSFQRIVGFLFSL